MNLSEMREFVVAETGRVDLLNKRIGPTRLIDVYINHGARMLDRRINDSDISVEVPYTLSLGDDAIPLRVISLQYVDAVYVEGAGDSAKGVTKLRKISSIEARSLRSAQIAAYTPPSVWWLTNSPVGIVQVFPAAFRQLEIYLYGKLQSSRLNQDADTNFWSIWHEDLLVEAASWQIERANRNTEGMRDKQAAIEILIQDLDKDIIGGEEDDYEGAIDMPVRP